MSVAEKKTNEEDHKREDAVISKKGEDAVITKKSEDDAISKKCDDDSLDPMMSYITDYGSRVLVGDKQLMKNILDIVYYEEKDCISTSGTGESECVIITLRKIQNKDKIKQIYDIVYRKVESLKNQAK